jgi:hypothetical protein
VRECEEEQGTVTVQSNRVTHCEEVVPIEWAMEWAME